jgi:hypothetical protein
MPDMMLTAVTISSAIRPFMAHCSVRTPPICASWHRCKELIHAAWPSSDEVDERMSSPTDVAAARHGTSRDGPNGPTRDEP